MRRLSGGDTEVKSIEYLAGLFDGEGSFSIQVGLRQHKSRHPTVYFNPSMSVNLYYGAGVLSHFQEMFGGQIYPYKKAPGAARWHLGRQEMLLPAARALQPHLVIKSIICERFLHALSLFPARGGTNLRAGDRVWDPVVAVEVAEIALTLNPPRSRKSNKSLEYLTVFKAGLDLHQSSSLIDGGH